jgi:hypothetical protein
VTPSWNAGTHRIDAATPATGNANHYILFKWTNADSIGKTTRRIRYRHWAYDNTLNAVTRPLIAEYRSQNGVMYLEYNAYDSRGSFSSAGKLILPYTDS